MGFFKRRRRARLGKATLVTREWTPDRGVVEHEATLASLAELLQTCLDSGSPLPERIVLTGVDGEGGKHSVSFLFAATATTDT